MDGRKTDDVFKRQNGHQEDSISVFWHSCSLQRTREQIVLLTVSISTIPMSIEQIFYHHASQDNVPAISNPCCPASPERLPHGTGDSFRQHK